MKKTLVILVLVIGLGFGLKKSLSTYPRINDITTSISPLVSFVQETKPYPGHFWEIQSKHYANLAPLKIQNHSPSQALSKVHQAALTMNGWQDVRVYEKELKVEAVSVTKLLRFRDDVVIEVRKTTEPGTLEVHMRSKSRMGQGDLGANAKRITDFFKILGTKFERE